MGPQEDVIRNVHGVLHVPGRMVFRQIQALEVIVIRFDIRPFDDGEAHAQERVFHQAQSLMKGMFVAHDRFAARQGNVDFFRFDLRSQFLGLDFFHLGLELFFDGIAGRVDELADFRPFFFGKILHFLHDCRQFPFFTQELDADILYVLKMFALGELFIDGRFDGLDLITDHTFFLLLASTKKIDSRPLRGESLIRGTTLLDSRLSCNGNPRPAYSVQQEALK